METHFICSLHQCVDFAETPSPGAEWNSQQSLWSQVTVRKEEIRKESELPAICAKTVAELKAGMKAWTLPPKRGSIRSLTGTDAL